MKTPKKAEVNVHPDIYTQLANATSVKDIEDFVNDMLNVVNFPTLPKEKWGWFAGKIQQKDPTLARFLQYADKRVNEEFAIETSAQALDFGKEQAELEKSILAWEPKLENIQEWLNATKKADNWADLKKIWDALWMSKEQTSPYEQPPMQEFKEFIDLGDADEAPLELGAKKAQSVDPVVDKIDFIKKHINVEDVLKDLAKTYDPKSIDNLLDEVIQNRGLAERYRLEKERIPESKLNEIIDMSAKKAQAQPQDSLVDVISNDPSEVYNFLFEKAEDMLKEEGKIDKKELAEGFFTEVYYLYEGYSKDQILEACWELADMFADELSMEKRAQQKEPAEEAAENLKKKRLDKKIRNDVQQGFTGVGLDGNGRFKSPGDVLNYATHVLGKVGIELDELPDSMAFNADSGHVTLRIAWTNPVDSMWPVGIENSSLALSWYKRNEDNFEGLAYLG